MRAMWISKERPRFENPPAVLEVWILAMTLPLLYVTTGLIVTNRFVVVLQIAYLFLPALYLVRRHGLRQRAWNWQDAVRVVVVVAGTLLVAWLLNRALPAWHKIFPLPKIYESMYRQMLEPRDSLWWLWQGLGVGLIPAISEELFFRGFFLTSLLREGKNPWMAIILSAVLFSAYHINPWYFPFFAVLGLWMGAVYIYSGRLEFAMLAHLTNNIYSLVLHHH